MKKLYTQITKKNGEGKNVYVCVDNETAKVLEQVDEETRRIYLQEEYLTFMSNVKYKRSNQSLEKSLENGFDVVDENQDVEENAIKNADIEKVRRTISQLEPQQQWLVKQVYFNQRTNVSIASELGVTEGAIRDRLKRIFEKIKKFLK